MRRKFFADDRKYSRCVFVGNIPYDANEEGIKEFFFSIAGHEGCQVRLVYDKGTGHPKGYGFVEFASAAQAQSAIRNLDGHIFRGRKISVHEAEDNSVRMERSLKRQRIRREPTYTKTTDQVTEVVKGLDQHTKVDILQEMKRLIETTEQGARDLLMENPQLAQALLIIQLDFEMCSRQKLVKVVEPVTLPPALKAQMPGLPIENTLYNQIQPQTLIPMPMVPVIMPPPHLQPGLIGPPRPVAFPRPQVNLIAPQISPKALPGPAAQRVLRPPVQLSESVEPKIEPGRKPPLQSAFKSLDSQQQRVLKDVLALRPGDITKLDPEVQKKIMDLRRQMSA